MATIFAVFAVHEGGCSVSRDPRDCDCNYAGGRKLVVEAEFNPESVATLRERVQLARMAALFKAREAGSGANR